MPPRTPCTVIKIEFKFALLEGGFIMLFVYDIVKLFAHKTKRTLHGFGIILRPTS
jgi:uncharacterized membrane protein YGL010W